MNSNNSKLLAICIAFHFVMWWYSPPTECWNKWAAMIGWSSNTGRKKKTVTVHLIRNSKEILGCLCVGVKMFIFAEMLHSPSSNMALCYFSSLHEEFQRTFIIYHQRIDTVFHILSLWTFDIEYYIAVKQTKTKLHNSPNLVVLDHSCTGLMSGAIWWNIWPLKITFISHYLETANIFCRKQDDS